MLTMIEEWPAPNNVVPIRPLTEAPVEAAQPKQPEKSARQSPEHPKPKPQQQQPLPKQRRKRSIKEAMKDSKKRKPRHFQWSELLVRRPAWKALGFATRVVYASLELRFNGYDNNGRIAAPVRSIADEIGASPSYVAYAMRDLQAKGFIKITRHGTYGSQGGHATLIALTAHPVDGSRPTMEFERWSPNAEFEVQLNKRQQRAGHGNQQLEPDRNDA